MRISRKLLFFVVLALVLYIIISKLHIVVLVSISLWQALIAVAVITVVLFLLLDHLLNRDKSRGEA
jgi:hypothetical protein